MCIERIQYNKKFWASIIQNLQALLYQNCHILDITIIRYSQLFLKQKFLQEMQNVTFEELKF